MTIAYNPVSLFLQPVDDFGMDVGDALNTLNDALICVGVGDKIRDPRYVSPDVDAHLSGEWTVQERVFSENNGTICYTDHAPTLLVSRNLTIYIRQL
jgi:hypothetical protein